MSTALFRYLSQLRVLRLPSLYFGAALIAVVWLAALQQVETERQHNDRRLTEITSDFARVFEENVIRSISEVDKVLQFLRISHGKMDEQDWAQLIHETALSSELTFQLAIIDADGFLAGTNVANAPQERLNLSDREHFRVHQRANKDFLFISRPVLGRASKKWSIQLTRRLVKPDGTFDGVIVASVDPNHFAQFYATVNLGSGTSIALIGDDGIVRVGFGPQPVSMGDSIRDSKLKEVATGAEGSFIDASEPNTRGRILSYRRVRGYPLMVTVGIDADQPNSSWLRNQPYYIGSAGLLTLLTLLAIAITARHKSARTRDEARIRRKSQELEQTLDNMNQGILMVDKEENIAVINRRYARLLGLPETFLDARPTYGEVVAFLEDAGEFSRGAAKIDNEALEYIRKSVLAAPVHVFERTRPDGTVLEVRSERLPDGGFVRTLTDITMRRRAEAQIVHLAKHDGLTDLANRVLFRERLDQALSKLKDGQLFAVHLIDLDRFKNVNDTLGHAAGDKLLNIVGARLKHCVRSTDVIARIGGDEFAVIQLDMWSAESAARLASDLAHRIGEPYAIDDQHLLVGASVGSAIAPTDGRSARELLKAADLALYQAKADGRGTYRFFEPEMVARLKAREEIEGDLRKALANGEFVMHYQPLVNLQTKEVTGYEALIRWHHPTRGMVAPTEFISIAEETGLIFPIGAWALNTACAEMAGRPGNLRVAVNLSPAQFMNRELARTIEDALIRSGLDPEQLELEITESTLLQRDQFTIRQIAELRALGVHIAMDDFGTGYSSLSYLLSYPIDRIKIDRSFVSALDEREECAAIVRAIVALASSLGMLTTAEGVETREQLEQLLELGCIEAQGFYFGKAQPAADVLPARVLLEPKAGTTQAA